MSAATSPRPVAIPPDAAERFVGQRANVLNPLPQVGRRSASDPAERWHRSADGSPRDWLNNAFYARDDDGQSRTIRVHGRRSMISPACGSYGYSIG